VLSITLAGFGHALSVAGELDEARNAFARAAELAREMESSHALTVALGSLGEVARLAGDLEAASEYYEQALEAGGRHARSNPIAIILANLGGVSIEKQNFKAARGYYRESLGIAVELQNTLWSAVAIDGLAAVALDAGDIERSALLAGAAEALHESSRSAAEKWELSLRDRYVESLRSLLDEETLKKLWSRGRNMTLSEATTAALES
jgi:tetratricopeptide (TPR) repeat protein